MQEALIMQTTATRLRAELFNTLDYIVATGESVEVQRPGGCVRIVRDNSTSRLAALQSHPGIINGDAEDLASLSWEQTWQPTL
jgi:hypothetical protein